MKSKLVEKYRDLKDKQYANLEQGLILTGMTEEQAHDHAMWQRGMDTGYQLGMVVGVVTTVVIFKLRR